MAKEYFRYFQRNNLSKILAKLEQENTDSSIETHNLKLNPLLSKEYLQTLCKTSKP